MRIRACLPPLFATMALVSWAGVAAADPAGLTTLPIGADGARLPAAGRRWQDLQLEGLRRRQGAGRDLHLQPLPDRAGI